MSLSSTDTGLLTPGNCAGIFVDHRPHMLFGVANIEGHPELFKSSQQLKEIVL
jgi:hypothetical protein